MNVQGLGTRLAKLIWVLVWIYVTKNLGKNVQHGEKFNLWIWLFFCLVFLSISSFTSKKKKTLLHCLKKRKKSSSWPVFFFMHASCYELAMLWIKFTTNKWSIATWLYNYNNLSKYSIILVRCSLLSECRLCMVYTGRIFSKWGTAGMACVVMGRAGFLRQRCRGIHTVAVWYCPIFYTGDVHEIIGSSKRFWMFDVSSCIC